MKTLVMYSETAREKSLTPAGKAPLSLSVERRSAEMYIQKRKSVIHITLLASAVSAEIITAFHDACSVFFFQKKY